MKRRAFGRSGLQVSALGFGAGHIGDPVADERAIERLLNAVLDLGINLIDTARGYGISEERIGRHLAARRAEFVLSTKVGYDIPGFADWTGPIITAGVAAALKRLRTDYLDVVHLHSCPREVLDRGDVVEALVREVEAGRIRVAAYSGDNEALDWAVASGRFGSVQCSVNVADQHALKTALPEAARQGLGVIAKRPLANAAWRFAEQPVGEYAEEYWKRMRKMGFPLAAGNPSEIALRFATFAPGVHCAILGTRRLEHLKECIEFANRGPLSPSEWSVLRDAFRNAGVQWTGQT